MAIDVLKGIAAVIGCRVLISPDIMCVSIAGIASIIGHNYPVWLKGKGGRGLSTAAGVMLVLGWYFVGIWCLVWGICYGVSKNIHLANLIALVLSPVVIFCTPSQFYHLGFPAYTGSNQIFIVVTSITLIVLIRHAGPIAELWKSNHA